MTSREPLNDSPGTIPTLNQRGRTSLAPNEYSQAFIEYAHETKGLVLDIGAAFGVASIPAVEAGATVIANDIEQRHLEVLWERTPKHHRSRLILKIGRFPDDLSFPEKYLDAVHAANLLNFLRGEEILRGLALIWGWLKPGGKVFTNSGTPYAANIQGFIPVYEDRKRHGIRWPGEAENVQQYSSHQTLSELPPFIHLLDDEVIRNAFEALGFIVEKAEMYMRNGLPEYLSYDGRENVGVIAAKPAEDLPGSAGVAGES
jgi:SAM-dependent methyltransferase